MTEYKFTNMETGMWFLWRGTSTIDALVRQWATCLPDTPLCGPLRGPDGHVYHLRLDEEGMREIKILATPTQFRSETI